MIKSLYRTGALLSIGVSISFLIFAVYLFAYSDEAFRQYAAFVSIFGILLPELLRRYTRLGQVVNKEMNGLILVMWSVAVALNGIGALGFYLEYQYYDLALHVIGPVTVHTIAALYIGGWLYAKNRWNIKRVISYSFIVSGIIIIGWEGWEWIGDTVFGTKMLGQPGEAYDTLYDIIAGVLALIPASIVLYRYLHLFIVWTHKKN